MSEKTTCEARTSEGYYWDDESCTCKSICHPDAQMISGACKCKAGYYGDGLACWKCPDGSTSAQGSSYCSCPKGSYWANGSCITCSPEGTTTETSGATSPDKCNKCKEGYYLKNSKCEPCPLDSYCPGDQTEHICAVATRNDSDGIKPFTEQMRSTQKSDCKSCAQLHPQTPVYDSVNDECTTCYGYYGQEKPHNDNGICKACPNGQIWDKDNEICTEITTCDSRTGVCKLNGDIKTCKKDYIAIYTKEQLEKIGDYYSGYPSNGNYCLMNSLTIDNFTKPICGTSYFTGIFDGNENSITYNISDSSASSYKEYCSLFGFVDRGTIMNLHVNATIEAGNGICGEVAGLASKVDESHIDHCSATVNIANNKWRTAGFIGYARDSVITHSWSEGSVSSVGDYVVAGFIGTAYNSSIDYSYSTATVHHEGDCNATAGFIADSAGSVINACYYNGDVDAIDHGANIGGFVGDSNSDLITNCYSWGDVSCECKEDAWCCEYVGAFAGYIGFATSDEDPSQGTYNSYAYASNVTGRRYVGGFVGAQVLSTISDSFATVTTVKGKPYTITKNGGTAKTEPDNIGGFAGVLDGDDTYRCAFKGSVSKGGSTSTSVNIGLFTGLLQSNHEIVNACKYNASGFNPIGKNQAPKASVNITSGSFSNTNWSRDVWNFSNSTKPVLK